MDRSVLESCLPGLVALAVCFGALRIIGRLSGARWDLSRLRRVHHCDQGGVQSLAFVLTFPLFLAILMLIAQIGLLMVAQMVVHYSAFAAVRAACVWIPAEVCGYVDEPANWQSVFPQSNSTMDSLSLVVIAPSLDSPKLQQIRSAAVQAIAPICPSADLGAMNYPSMASLARISAQQQAYAALVPASLANTRISARLQNKLVYADQNTLVTLRWLDANSPQGRDSLSHRSYNPRNHPDPAVVFDPHEAGWQDPLTVRVEHQYALLPGPGRLLAKYIVRADGQPDTVAPRIQTAFGYSQRVNTVRIFAEATLSNEGIKSVRPYVYVR